MFVFTLFAVFVGFLVLHGVNPLVAVGVPATLSGTALGVLHFLRGGRGSAPTVPAQSLPAAGS
ncbi:hypothetical protein [Nocardia sp. NPDC046763]|uniref:hypothetical protein n=1 Tax=Nocardia sp. NPDC046763 TaxID=3155256 RepID=UPI0033CFEED8